MRRGVAALLLFLAATSCSGGGRARGAAPRFERVSCPPAVPRDPRVRCGYLHVPEDRSRPGRTIRVAVAVVKARSARAAADPLLYVSGGPGDAALVRTSSFLESPIVEDRDLVLVDLRGVGLSRPSLACPEVAAHQVELLRLGSYDRGAADRSLALTRQCHDRLVRAGINLRAYDYTEMAADLADLRGALGYRRWNVYGISNGGRLALELVRRHPDGIRSLVLDAALPPQGNYFVEQWPHAQRAFEVLFAGCAADARCNAAYPHLEQAFFDLVARLDASPVTAGPAGAQVRFDGAAVLGSLRGALYETPLIPLLPQFISELARGRGFDAVAPLVTERYPSVDQFSLGENLSDNCREEVSLIRSGTFERQAKHLPRLRRVILDDTDARVCRVWGVGRADPSLDRPVDSDIPALLLVGQYDPVHPRASSEAIARHLRRHWLFELPGLGHGTVGAHPCAGRLVQAFLDRPTARPNAGCAAAMGPPRFVV